jgi:hypothetical protein
MLPIEGIATRETLIQAFCILEESPPLERRGREEETFFLFFKLRLKLAQGYYPWEG